MAPRLTLLPNKRVWTPSMLKPAGSRSMKLRQTFD